MIRKYRSFVQFEKEEAWLATMAQSGYWFTGRTIWGGYTFQEEAPQDIRYRIDYRTFKKKADFFEYVQLFFDSGWRHVYGTPSSGAQYFIPEKPTADADIFYDYASKAGRYRRYSETWFWLLVLYTILFISFCLSGAIDFSAILHPQQLYYTPGLWQMSGFDFWRAFLFETPFALVRGFSWVLYVMVFGIFLYLTIRSLLESCTQRF